MSSESVTGEPAINIVIIDNLIGRERRSTCKLLETITTQTEAVRFKSRQPGLPAA